MNRERLTILRDHLAGLPPERVEMGTYVSWPGGPMGWRAEPVGEIVHNCESVACIAGWAVAMFSPSTSENDLFSSDAAALLGLGHTQQSELFCPEGYDEGLYDGTDAIAAIQSMLDSPDDDALPVWPDADAKATASEAGQ